MLDDLERLLPGVPLDRDRLGTLPLGTRHAGGRQGLHLQPAARDAAKPLGRLFFAGHDAEGLPAFENAVTSAVRAAGEAAAVLAAASAPGEPGALARGIERRGWREESPGRQPGESRAGWPRSPKGCAKPRHAGSRWIVRPFRACEPSCPWQSPGLCPGLP